jgi:hypothetical protein
MGALGAQGMAAAVNDGLASQRQALSWHLSSNHYPPINAVFIPVAERAIELANDGEWDETIEMPNGITKRVWNIIEELHLESFLVSDDDWEDEDDDG